MSPRRLSDDERALWKGVTRSIAPLTKRTAPSPSEAAPPTSETSVHRRAKAAAKLVSAALPAVRPKPAAPPLTPLDRKTKKRVARGSTSIDGRLDLHGMTQDEAHGALFAFLCGRQSRGGRLVLVITGKGGQGRGGGEGRGILKRMVPLWLALPEFRDLVIGFEAAAIGHGGEGALYVRLRRLRVADAD